MLGLPEPRVLNAIKTAWHADRKPANVAVVVDTSGSMQDEQTLQQAQRGLEVFFRQFSPRDRVGLVTFSNTVRTIVPLGDVRTNRRLLSAAAAKNQERNIRVFTIAYGSAANKDVLRAIAAASGGKDYEGDPEEIEDVYRQISSYF